MSNEGATRRQSRSWLVALPLVAFAVLAGLFW
nr:DsbE family thiol:disulfide interchange protein [Afipia sp.]